MNYKEVALDKIKGWDVGQVAAVTAARRSPLKKFHTGAALVKDNKVVEIGWSHVGHIQWKETPWSTHAEAHLLHRASFRPEGCDLYIATISAKGNLTLGLPCDSCTSLLNSLNPKTVNFTTPDETWETYIPEDLCKAKDIWQTRGY